jgi:DNA polymerase delta subunit 2
LEDNKDQVVSGTLYKNMKLKPTALLEYTQDKTVAAQLNAETFCDDSDSLVIEDESARVTLTGAHLDVGALVSGVIIAVRGTFDSTAGVFVVKQHLFAGALCHLFENTAMRLLLKCNALPPHLLCPIAYFQSL